MGFSRASGLWWGHVSCPHLESQTRSWDFLICPLIIINFFFFVFFGPSFPLSSPLVFYFFYSTKWQFVFSYHLFTSFFFFLFSDTFSFFGFTCSFLTYPQKSLPIFVCPPPSPTPQTKLSIEKKGCVACLFCRVWTHLIVLISFRLRTIRNWKGAKKSWDTFKEKEEIWLTWIGLHYLNAQWSQLPHFILFNKQWTNA